MKTKALLCSFLIAATIISTAAVAQPICAQFFVTDAAQKVAAAALAEMSWKAGASIEANAVLNQIRRESALPKAGSTGNWVPPPTFTYGQPKGFNVVTPLLHQISPKLFPENGFQVYRPEGWAALSKGTHLMDHFEEVLHFWSADRKFAPNDMDSPTLLMQADARLIELVRQKILLMPTSKQNELSVKIGEFLQSHKGDYLAIRRLMFQLQTLRFSNEILVFEVAALYQEYAVNQDLSPSDRRLMLRSTKDATEAMTKRLAIKSRRLQEIIVQTFKDEPALYSMILPVTHKLIEPVEKLLLQKLRNLELSLDERIAIAAYFVKDKALQPEATQLLYEMMEKATDQQYQKIESLIYGVPE